MSIQDKVKQANKANRSQLARDTLLSNSTVGNDAKDQAASVNADANVDNSTKSNADSKKPTGSNAKRNGKEKINKADQDKTNDQPVQPELAPESEQSNQPKQPDQEVVEVKIPSSLTKRRKKERMSDTHTSQAYYIQNDILEVINEIVGDEWGGKYRLVNDALKLYIHTFHEDLAKKIKDLP